MFSALVNFGDLALDYELWYSVSAKNALFVRLGSTVAVFGPICIFIWNSLKSDLSIQEYLSGEENIAQQDEV